MCHPELLAAIPAPTVTDAITQYVKNMSQFGILLALLMTMGVVVQEKERGTAAFFLTRPVSRETFLLAKFAALTVTFIVSLALAAIGCWYYTLVLFAAAGLGTLPGAERADAGGIPGLYGAGIAGKHARPHQRNGSRPGFCGPDTPRWDRSSTNHRRIFPRPAFQLGGNA